MCVRERKVCDTHRNRKAQRRKYKETNAQRHRQIDKQTKTHIDREGRDRQSDKHGDGLY